MTFTAKNGIGRPLKREKRQFSGALTPIFSGKSIVVTGFIYRKISPCKRRTVTAPMVSAKYSIQEVIRIRPSAKRGESIRPRKTLEKTTDRKHNVSRKNAAYASVDDFCTTGRKTVTGTLQDNHGTWTVYARVFNPRTGKMQQRSKTTGCKVKSNTKRVAERIMRDIIEEWELEANAITPTRNPLFSEYVEKWLEKKETTKRANTALSYRQYAEKHILPVFGDCKVQSITRQMLQNYANEKLKTLSVNTLKKHFVVINGALHDAVLDDILAANPAGDNIEFPTAKKFEGHAYTPEQISVLLKGAAAEGEPIYSAIILAVFYGLRRSEICGLRWKDIDFDAGEMYIRNTKTQNGTLVIDAEQTKTPKSRRTIGLIAGTVPYLQSLKQSQEQAGFPLGKVCVWADGTEVRPDYVSHRAQKIMKNCGLKIIRLHDLRHTAASLLATQATPKQIQGFLGHADIATTMETYTHLLDADRKSTSAIMDSILKKADICL